MWASSRWSSSRGPLATAETQGRERKSKGSGYSVGTSFNGDYVGYLLPQRRYSTPHFETRGENLFGPWCGEYFNEISRRVVARLSATHSR